MHAIIFYLVTFGYIDGDFDASEKASSARSSGSSSSTRERGDARRRGVGPRGGRRASSRSTSTRCSRGSIRMQAHFTESVAENEDPKAFVHAKLKVRCFEIFQSFDEGSRRAHARDRRALICRRRRPPGRAAVPDELARSSGAHRARDRRLGHGARQRAHRGRQSRSSSSLSRSIIPSSSRARSTTRAIPRPSLSKSAPISRSSIERSACSSSTRGRGNGPRRREGLRRASRAASRSSTGTCTCACRSPARGTSSGPRGSPRLLLVPQGGAACRPTFREGASVPQGIRRTTPTRSSCSSATTSIAAASASTASSAR